MNFKISTAIGFSLALTSALVINDASTAQARGKPCNPHCTIFDGVKIRRGYIPVLIKEGDALKQERKYDLAQAKYTQARELAKQNGDAEGEAIADSKLGELYTTTGNLEAASTHFTAAKTKYETLQNQEGINSVNRQLGKVQERQLQLQLRQINPSQFKIHQ
jgi:tetratricopeptide (TPR) repeat protein